MTRKPRKPPKTDRNSSRADLIWQFNHVVRAGRPRRSPRYESEKDYEKHLEEYLDEPIELPRRFLISVAVLLEAPMKRPPARKRLHIHLLIARGRREVKAKIEEARRAKGKRQSAKEVNNEVAREIAAVTGYEVGYIFARLTGKTS